MAKTSADLLVGHAICLPAGDRNIVTLPRSLGGFELQNIHSLNTSQRSIDSAFGRLMSRTRSFHNNPRPAHICLALTNVGARTVSHQGLASFRAPIPVESTVGNYPAYSGFRSFQWHAW